MAMVTKENYQELAKAHIRRKGEGFVLANTHSLEARLWRAYWRIKQIPASFIAERLAAGNPVTVPDQTPAEFDPEARGLRPDVMSEAERTSYQLTTEEREAAVRRFRAIFPAIPAFRAEAAR